jgi:transposase
VAPHIIDKGIPTAGLLAQVLVAKFLDHMPLYRQERFFVGPGDSSSIATSVSQVCLRS